MTTRGGIRTRLLGTVAAGLICACTPPEAPESASLALLDDVWWTEPAVGDVRAIAWADFEPDGDLDLAVVEHNGAIRTYRNDDGSLIPGPAALAEEVDGENGPESVLVVDLDAPGSFRPEIIVGGDASDLLIYDVDDEGGLTVRERHEGLIDVNGLAAGDFDGDQLLDVAVARDGEPNAVLRNVGGSLSLPDGWEEPAESDGIEEITLAVAWGDVDGDGRPDLAFAEYDRGPSFRVLRNTGAGSFAPHWSSSDSGNGRGVAWADADGDGDLDLAAGTRADDPSRIYLNDGGQLQEPPLLLESTGSRFGAAWGDGDGDGRPDLVLAGPDGAELMVNLGGGDFELAAEYAPPAAARTKSSTPRARRRGATSTGTGASIWPSPAAKTSRSESSAAPPRG